MYSCGQLEDDLFILFSSPSFVSEQVVLPDEFKGRTSPSLSAFYVCFDGHRGNLPPRCLFYAQLMQLVPHRQMRQAQSLLPTSR
ncbi:hypothetical protein PsAD2_03527 [Pseudovibrio axinellae]|uniref:Uncharacterized protein n=1 Tax=Pseudovibrio axinellae TaxID=989403 RepID=A0A165W0E5_9HYPH|nr:hypothetical protein PsAD2_03527 [Pseudovibrio axinellae]SEQ62941.1 hypothetical protein SAMN05421798_103275 [Pseudovibrio axinellae]